MEPQILKTRISQCIDDLGLLLDQIYKFPQRQRELFFDRIQFMKNKLVNLKMNLLQSNASATQKQYKKFYLDMNTLKNEIYQQNVLLPSAKQNKEIYRNKDIKQLKKNYQEAMKLLVFKDEQITNLKNLLFEKQQLIRINYEDHKKIKEQYELLLQNNRLVKYEHNNNEIQMERKNAFLLRAQSEMMDMKIYGQEKDKAFNSAIEELERLKVELINANEKLIGYERLAEINITKNKLLEQNMRKVEREAQGLNQNYRLKQSDNFKKLREIGQLQLELNVKADQLKQIEQQNRRLRQDIQVIDCQLNKLQTLNAEQKGSFNRQKQYLHREIAKFEEQRENAAIRQSEFKNLLDETDKKYLIVINKLNSAEEFKAKLTESQCQKQMLIKKIHTLEMCIKQCHGEMQLLSQEKEKVLDMLSREQIVVRQLEVQLFKMKQKAKMKDEERGSLNQDLNLYKSKLIELQKQLTQRQKKSQAKENDLMQEKIKVIKTQQKYKARDKQIQSLKVKLLRAKIQTIHEIRKTII